MIARALMHAPRVLFLDEPTTGLDPAARLFVWDRLRELRDSDVTLILTTHDMDEAALLADRVGIMDHGQLLALDTPEALIDSLEGEGTLELSGGSARGRRRRRRARGARRRRAGGDGSRRRGERRPEPVADSQPLRVRLYLTGDAALLVAPAAAVLARARPRAPGREARHADARGRLHPPHRTDAAMSARRRHRHSSRARSGAPSGPSSTATSTSPWRELHVFLAQVILQPLFLLFVFGKVLGTPRLHAARLHRPALSRPARAHRGDHGDADARVPARGRVRLDEGDRGPAARADADLASSSPRRCSSRSLRSLDRDVDHDPDRDPDPRLDPVALGRLPALRRRACCSERSSAPASAC